MLVLILHQVLGTYYQESQHVYLLNNDKYYITFTIIINQSYRHIIFESSLLGL